MITHSCAVAVPAWGYAYTIGPKKHTFLHDESEHSLRTLPEPDYVREAMKRVPVRVHKVSIFTDRLFISGSSGMNVNFQVAVGLTGIPSRQFLTITGSNGFQGVG